MKSSKRLPGLFNNWQAKLLCFLVAVFVYFLLAYGLQEKRTVTLPVNVIMPEDYVAVSLIPEQADLVIRGTEDRIYMVEVESIELTADFSGVNREGVSSVPLKIDLSGLDNYLNTEAVTIYTQPSSVKIYFEAK